MGAAATLPIDVSATDYEAADYAYVSEIFGGWAPSGVGTGFLGAVHEAQPLSAPPGVDPSAWPAPSEDPLNPSIYVVWDLKVPDLEGVHDTAQAPVRFGVVDCTIYAQRDAQIGPVLQTARALRELFAAQPRDGRLSFSPDLARAKRAPVSGSWYLRGLEIPFGGG